MGCLARQLSAILIEVKGNPNNLPPGPNHQLHIQVTASACQDRNDKKIAEDKRMHVPVHQS